MVSGTFSYNKRILNVIIKYSKNTELSKLILEEFSSNNIKKYIKDIQKCRVKTSTLYIKFKNILIESYIPGKTIDQILKTNSKEKLEVIRKLLQTYKKIKTNNNLCLDWNLKNFIYNKKELYYIDFIPCIYKDKLHQSKSKILKDYIDTYLNSDITLQGIYYYILKTILPNFNKEELSLFRSKLNKIYQEELNIQLNFNTNHPYSKSIKEIDKYLSTNISLDELKKNLKKYSIEEKINEDLKKKYV